MTAGIPSYASERSEPRTRGESSEPRCPSRPLAAPSSFRPVRALQWAQLSEEPPGFSPQAPLTRVKRQGILFELRAQRLLSLRYSPELRGPLYAPGPWIRFIDSGQRRYAQPDGLLVDFTRGLLTIIEIKLNHTVNAWFWLRQLYEPLVRHLFGPAWRYALCEVVRWYDSDLRFPEPVRLTTDPSSLSPHEFGVHILRS